MIESVILGVFDVEWLFLIIALIVIVSVIVGIGIALYRYLQNANNQPQNQNLLIEDAAGVIGYNNVILRNQNQILLIRNVDEDRNNLVNESELHGNIILANNGNLNLERKDFVDQEGIRQLVEIFAKIAEYWQNLAKEVKNLYDIKNYSNALNEEGLKLQKISEDLTGTSATLVSIKNFPANIINSKLVSDFLD